MSGNMIIEENFTAAFVNTNQRPIRSKHICWYTTDYDDCMPTEIGLVEVVREFYKHPQSDLLEVSIIKEYTRSRTKSPNAKPFTILMKYIQEEVDDAMSTNHMM